MLKPHTCSRPQGQARQQRQAWPSGHASPQSDGTSQGTQGQDVITKVTSHLTLQVVRGRVTRDELLLLRSITAGQVGSHPILGARIVEHGYVGRRAVVEGDDVLASRVSNVCSLLLNWPVSCGEGLHAVAQEREHGNTAVLELLHFQVPHLLRGLALLVKK